MRGLVQGISGKRTFTLKGIRNSQARLNPGSRMHSPRGHKNFGGSQKGRETIKGTRKNGGLENTTHELTDGQPEGNPTPREGS